MSNNSRQTPRYVSVAVSLLCVSATYSCIVEIWSAPVLFAESEGPLFVGGLIAAVLGFYALYGWLVYATWKGSSAARLILVAVIAIAIALHASLALTAAGKLFGPASITVFLDGLRAVAVVLLLVSPRAYWRQPA
jgi:hypothetical protein